MENDDKTFLSGLVKGADKLVNITALILFLLLLLYGVHGIWYTHSLKAGSFLPDELAKYRPDGERPTLEELVEMNPDVRGWITIDDTHIDYPVVQGKDNTEYLNKDVMGGFSLAGAIFLSAKNKEDFSDAFNMLYGHHIEGGAMFTDVLEFKDASFFKNHKEGTLWYPEGAPGKADRIEIFALVEESADNMRIFGDPTQVSPQELPGYVGYIRSLATNDRDTDISSDDRIIALSTCEDAVSFKRVILFGKLRPMTDAEIKEAMTKEENGATSQRGGFQGFIDRMPAWTMPVGGILSLALIVYILWRRYKVRREQAKERKYRGE